MEQPIVFVERGTGRWPGELDRVEGAPDGLWMRGREELLEVRPRIAIVGTRSPTPYGLTQAERFARGFAEAGACVVSGLARGVDATAHRSALDAGGATIGVLACGVDRPWPSGPLADRMAAEGLLLSELEPGTPPSKPRFPLRNRLISGLACAVLVVEAARRSGSLITARWALDQGVDVWAVPGRVDQPMAGGCHDLLRDGASLAEGPEQVLESIGLRPASRSPAPDASLDEHDRALLRTLEGDTPDAATIARRVGRPIATVLARLALLELHGHLARAPGGLYRRLERRG